MATRPGLRRSQASGDTTIYQMKIVFRCSNSLAGKAEASRCNSVALWRGVLMRHGDWTFPADGGRGVHSRSCLGDTVAPETMASRRHRMGTETAPRCGQTAGCDALEGRASSSWCCSQLALSLNEEHRMVTVISFLSSPRAGICVGGVGGPGSRRCRLIPPRALAANQDMCLLNSIHLWIEVAASSKTKVTGDQDGMFSLPQTEFLDRGHCNNP